ncbi:U3 snoRNP protein [Rhizina undulata]
MADKARYFLEQSVPELQELEKKKIFTKEELSAITKKRSDFEHRINASGCKPADFTRYAEYEMNLEALCRKRTRRLGLKSRIHFGQRRIFFILERATRKFYGDVTLWMQYIEYAKKEKAPKILAKVFSSALKMHPTKPELWIYAAKHAMEENADMTEARSHMQRGLRFNKYSKLMWLEYAKLEMVFIAKVLARRRLLGIDQPIPESAEEKDDDDESMLSLPTITAEEIDPTLKKDQSLDTMALENVDTNPALNGAIASAIFESAMKEIPGDAKFAEAFFELFREFRDLKCRGTLLENVVKYIVDNMPTSPEGLFLAVKLPILDIEVADPIFPSRLGTVLSNIAGALQKASPRSQLYELVAQHFISLLRSNEEMDPAVRKVILMSLLKYFKQAEKDGDVTSRLFVYWAELMAVRGKGQEALEIVTKGLASYPGDATLKEAIEELKSL